MSEPVTPDQRIAELERQVAGLRAALQEAASLNDLLLRRCIENAGSAAMRAQPQPEAKAD